MDHLVAQEDAADYFPYCILIDRLFGRIDNLKKINNINNLYLESVLPRISQIVRDN